MAETRQSQIVAKALSQRIVARNEMVLPALRQSAADRLTHALMMLYLQYYRDIKPLSRKLSANVHHPDIPRFSLVEAMEVALEFGIIIEAKSDSYISVPLDDAIEKLKEIGDNR